MSDDPANLVNLRDLVMPDPVSIWPLSPGWWWLLALLLAVAGSLAAFALFRYRANAYRRAALRELSKTSSVDELAALLKRTALVAGTREGIASLSGRQWIDWLASSAPGLTLPPRASSELLEATYTTPDQPPSQELLGYVSQWINKHRA